jgi:cytochrome c oxidase subunit 2
MNWSWILPESFSTFTGDVDAIYYVILWITGIVFVITEGLLVYFVLRYRHKEGRRATFDHGSSRMEVAWTVVPLMIVIWIGVASKGVWDRMKRDVPDNAMEVIVTAQQFEWQVTYPGLDGVLGTEDDFTLLNQLHAPQDRPILVYLRATDVLHSFFLPEMRVKQDAVPGQEIRVWFEAVAPGDYTLGCAELCGTGHTTMNGTLTVHSQVDYDAWVASQAAQQ